MNTKNVLATLLILSISFFLGSCGQRAGGEASLRQANGNKYYGGIFRLNESEYIKNLFPHNITDAYSYRVAQQVYEGLFKFNDETLKVESQLVDSFTTNEELTIYTFKLKEGVYFHDDECFDGGKGREMTAEDVAYCFTRLCTKHINNQSFASIFKGVLKGADEYYQATSNGEAPDSGVEGIKVIDKYTIQLELTEPFSLLSTNLARPACFIYPKEAEDFYGLDMRIRAVGTGPFYVSSVDEDINIILKRNEAYYGTDELGNQLPFLDAVNISFIKDKKSELFEFKKGNLDMIYRLPTEFIIEILEDANNQAGEYSEFELQRSPEMMTQFIALNNSKAPFDNEEVRKAFSFAIDRVKILDFVLNGEGFAAGLNGVTPPVFFDYNIAEIYGYSLNIDSARYYLNKAGYPGGEGFPTLQFFYNTEGERHTYVAVELQKQLKDHLNIDIELVTLPFAQLLEKAFKGEYEMMRGGWVSDYPSAENFLWLFLSKDVPNRAGEVSYPNIFRYINKDFDALYQKALNARSLEEANAFFQQGENLLIKDAPVIVLWYDEGYRLVQSHVQDFPNNPMQYRDLGKVYFDDAVVQ